MTLRRLARRTQTTLREPSPAKILPLDFELPSTYESIEKTFGRFDWHDVENSLGADIVIDPKWASKHIERIDLPGILPRHVWIHRLIARSFQRAMIIASEKCPSYPIISCASLSTRHKRHDRDADLSLHSWGIAFDVNPRSNPYGAFRHISRAAESRTAQEAIDVYYDLPDAFIEVMEESGFVWGGRFKHQPDPMHFQAAARVI